MLISKFDTTEIEKYIQGFEEKYNFRFPEQYRDFLLKYNGGETPKTDFRINKVSSDIKCFYGLGNAGEYCNYSFFHDYEIEEYLKTGILPIGSNSFGDYIVIGINEENNGIVFFYYHDRPKKYIPLTDDFATFIKKCKSKKIGHVRTIEERKAALIRNGNEKNITPGWIEAWQEEIDKYANMHQEELIL